MHKLNYAMRKESKNESACFLLIKLVIAVLCGRRTVCLLECSWRDPLFAQSYRCYRRHIYSSIKKTIF